MPQKTPVCHHMFTKLDLYFQLIRRRYHPCIAISIHAIVNTLTRTWPISTFHRELKRNFLNMVDLSIRLELEEHKIRLMWRHMLNDQMMDGLSVREQVMFKRSLVGSQQRAGFIMAFSTFIDVVVTILR